MRDIETIISELSKRTEIILEYRGTRVMDQQTALLLRLIEKYGSILRASISAGIPYSKAWDIITRIERTLGIKIVERKRGGARRGGTRLTDYGIKLLEYYEKLQHDLIDKHHKTMEAWHEYKEPDLIVMGSHDLLLERLLYILKNENDVKIHSSWIGSCGGILAIIIGEADIAGVHLLDPVTKRYNYNIIERYGLSGAAILVRGYDRELVLAYNPYYSYNNIDDIMNDIINGKIKIINRNRGSGTRLLFETLLKEYAQKISQTIDYNKIKGYTIEVNTHQEVAEYIASGKADTGITLRHLAEAYGLKYLTVAREQYDFIVNKDHIDKKILKIFIEVLKNKIMRLAVNLKGYYIPDNIGEKINGL